MPTKPLKALGFNLAALLLSVVAFIPVYIVIVNSLKTKAEASVMGIGLPTTLHFENFATVIEKGKLGQSFFNSMLYSVGSTAIGTILAAMAAFVLSRNRTRLNRFLYFFIIMGIALPTNYVTLTQVMQITQLINTQLGIIILHASGQIPFGIFLIYGFVQTVPRELDEAAIVDGCGPWRLFFVVIMPLLMPVMITLSVLSFLGAWSDFIAPLYFLNNSDYWPMTLAVYNFFGQFQSDWSLVSADILLTILPVLIVYLLAQRFILSGLTSGAVKG
ncbi:MAG: transporter permease [Chloroflexi bacterium]|jgi:raffinose/stachyose/melibiose transport system permease protein|nr:transporter permease [Chloroflexota bacterium]